MRFVRFFHDAGDVHLGLRREDTVFDLRTWSSVTALMNGAIGSLQDQIARATSYDIKELTLDAPIRDIPKLLALAGNFRKHIVESGFSDVQKGERVTPQFFCKPPSTTVNRPGGEITLRKSNVFLDWEVELGVVIGKCARDVHPADAMSCVFGYTVINDISEREFNSGMADRRVREFDPFFDWLIGKWFDGSAPLGPEIVTTDEIPDPHSLDLRLSVNGIVMQSSNTAQMIFDIPQTISYISSVLTLEPGDVIAMGTPDGVGRGCGIRLKPGDHIRAEVEKIGVLENTVVAGNS